ncbi:alpha/beta hydrolase family protein [Gordonia insulae]|uniref:alpha/beta hydrolase family protein n=1 Tax=Gordonia insulae TaxID=2420509 RepID=UPI0013DE7722|nr:alpha/beta hydrolase fold domain-containing protein [Gordonia insulae]
MVYPTPDGKNDPTQNFGDLYLPSAPVTGVPLAVLFHGGSWLSSAGDLRGLAPMARALADHGIAVFNVEYRRIGSGGGWPTTLTDAQAAVDFAAGLSHDHRSLADGVAVVAGHSAGGQLALWAGTHGRTPPRAVVSISGPADLAYAAVHGDRNVRAFLGGLPHQVPERYSLADPSADPPPTVPVLLLHGTRDHVVPIEVARHYLEDHPLPALPHPDLVEIAGGTHTSLVTPGRRGYSEVLTDVEKLIRQVMSHSPALPTHVTQGALSSRALGSTA